MTAGYLGLGSNVGDRVANLRTARDALARQGVTVTASSSVYETEPQGEVLDQPEFLNACLEVDTELGPEDLLDTCKVVEAEVGRMIDRYGAESVTVRAAKPEPPIALPVEEVSVEIWKEG